MTFDKLLAVLKPLDCILIIIYIMVVVKLLIMNAKYKKVKYFEISGNTFLNTLNSKTKRIVYHVYQQLQKLPGENKLLINLYIPREDGDTSRIDLLMICNSGIYIFDTITTRSSVYGNEKNRVWKKVYFNFVETTFPNPVWHTMGQTSALMNILIDVDKNNAYSFIVFNKHCRLKKIRYTIRHLYVLRVNHLHQKLLNDFEKRHEVFTDAQTDEIYKLMSKYVNADEDAKKRHVEELHSRHEPAEIAEVED